MATGQKVTYSGPKSDVQWAKVWRTQGWKVTCGTKCNIGVLWYATHRSPLGCISATYEATPSDSRRAMERTRPEIQTTCLTLTFNLLTWEMVRNAPFTPACYYCHQWSTSVKQWPSRGVVTACGTDGQSETNITTPLPRATLPPTHPTPHHTPPHPTPPPS